MPDPDTALLIINGALNPASSPAAQPAGAAPSASVAASANDDNAAFVDVGGAAPAPAPFKMASTLQPDGSHKIMVDPADPAYAPYHDQVMGVSSREYLPKGIVLPDDAKFPLTLRFGALPQSAPPQSFPVVEASPPPTTKPAAAPAPGAASPASPASSPVQPAAAAPDDIDSKLAIIHAALGAPSAPSSPAGSTSATPGGAAPTVPKTGPATGPLPTGAYYDRATDSVVDPNANAVAPRTGIAANIAAGGNAAAANTLGGPVDLTTAALNLGARGVNAATGANIPQIENPVGGSGWFQDALGLIGADPRKVVPQTLPEQLARSATGGAVSAVLPMGPAARFAGAANPVIAGVARTLSQAPVAAGISGATAGVGGALATDAAQAAGVPDAYMPYVDLAGQLAGGGVGAIGTSGAISAGRGAWNSRGMPFRSPAYLLGKDGLPAVDATGATVPAVGKPRDFQAAAHAVSAKAGMTPQALAGSIPTPAEAELVPGSVPTMGQATGNQGLLGFERHLETKNRDPFRMRSAQQNEARKAYMATLSPVEAQAQGSSEFVRARLAQIDRETEAERAQLKEEIRRHDATLGGTDEPSQIGGRMAGHVNARTAPVRAEAERGVAVAQSRVDAAAGEIGGERTVTREEEGRALRERLAQIDQQRAARVGRLFDSIDPDGKLALEAGALKRTADGLRAKQDASAGDKLSPRAEELIQLAQKAPPVVAFGWLKKLRENINRGIQEARNVGDTASMNALRDLKRQGIDMAIAEAVEHAAREEAPGVLAGDTEPANAMVGRLAGHASESGAHGADEATVARMRGKFADRRQGYDADGGVGRQTGTGGVGGVSGRSGGGAQRLSGSNGTAGQRGSRFRPGQGNPRLPGGKSSAPESFAQFLIRNGGIRDESGELASMGITNRTHPTLVRKNGVTHDRARELGIEGGYIPADNPLMPNRSSVNDVRDLLSREAAGDRAFRPEDMVERRAVEAYDRQAEQHAHSLEVARERVLDALEDLHGESGWLPDPWLDTAARDVAMGRGVHEAITDAETGWAHETIDADTARRAFGPAIGMPAGAVQDGLSIGPGGTHLKANFGREAAEKYTGANSEHGERKEIYHKGSVGEVLAPGKNGAKYALPDSAVLGNFWKGRDASGRMNAPARGRELVTALGSREAAVEALGDHAARDLRAVAGDGTGFNSSKLQNWLKAHGEALTEFPELRQRFGTLAKAQGELDAIKAKRDAIEKLNPIAKGQSGADTMAQYIVAGPKGGEAIDAYTRHTGGGRDAMLALHDGLLYSLRRKASVDGGLNLRSYEAWRDSHASALSRVPDLASKISDFAGAQRALEDAGARATAARDAYTASAARHYMAPNGGEIDPQASAVKLLASPTSPADAADLVRQMKGDPAALQGFRKGVADHLVTLSGTKEMSGAAFRKFIGENKTARTLANIFTSDQLDVIKAIAADIERSNRTVDANKISGSPGTAADSFGLREDPHDLAGPLGAEGVGELASHVLGLTGVGGVVARLAALAGRSFMARAKQAGLARQDQIASMMILHPEFGRAVLQAVRATNPGPGLIGRITGLLSNLAAAGQGMPSAVPYTDMQRGDARMAVGQ